MCASRWQMMLWYDWHKDAKASEFAAVPLKTKKTSQSVSKKSLIMLQALLVYSSSP
jgi:hypothetical protein